MILWSDFHVLVLTDMYSRHLGLSRSPLRFQWKISFFALLWWTRSKNWNKKPHSKDSSWEKRKKKNPPFFVVVSLVFFSLSRRTCCQAETVKQNHKGFGLQSMILLHLPDVFTSYCFVSYFTVSGRYYQAATFTRPCITKTASTLLLHEFISWFTQKAISSVQLFRIFSPIDHFVSALRSQGLQTV